MANLQCYVTTFNGGRTLLDVDFFAASLFKGLTAPNDVPPDLLVLALQEIAPIAYSFIGGTLLAPYFSRFNDAVKNATARSFGADAESYSLVAVEHVGMTAILVFALPETGSLIRRVETAGVGFGMWDMGNKGAVGVRLGLQRDSDDALRYVTFVAAHLAPMEDRWEQRNEDWRSTCEGLVFEKQQRLSKKGHTENSEDAQPLLENGNADAPSSEQHTLFSPSSYVFFAGDLNYRTSDSSPSPTDHTAWSNSADDYVSFAKSFEQDQLTRERNSNRTLHHLAEAEITFAPTYKYSSEAQRYAVQLSSMQDSQAATNLQIWAKHRIPSWCDRILFLKSAAPKVHAYTSLPVQPTSDHRPVVLSCSIDSRPSDALEAQKPPFAIRRDWKERRAAARRLEIAVGVAAYLTMTWEGEAVLGGTVVGLIGAYLVLRGMLGV